jgi:hypothetical protein
MADPLFDPIVPPVPPINPDPLSDPLLDAVERSIENPPGMSDPLVQGGNPAIDDLAGQLDQVEQNIENPLGYPPGPKHAPGVARGRYDDGLPEDWTRFLDGPDETDESLQERLDALEDKLKMMPNDSMPRTSERHDSSPCRSQAPLPPQPRRTGEGWSQPGIQPQLGGSRPRGRTGAGPIGIGRICPEAGEFVSEEQCQDCDKYRHWPEGTDEEPRECWHEWRERKPLTEPPGCEG